MLEHTPAPVSCLEDFQSNLPSMLHDSIFAITATVAATIAFVDMIPSLDECIPQTGSIEFGH